MGAAFVGRSAEMDALADAHARATAAEPVTVLIGGEAGIGKTRLIAEFTAGLPDGARVIEGGCLEAGAEQLAYAPFIAVTRSLVRDLGPERAAALLPGGGRRGLAHWLPVLGGPPNEPDPVYGRTWLFEDVLTLIEAAAGQRPLVLVLEDLHWADPSSRELLVFLVRNLSRPGVLLLCTYRSTDLDQRHPLRSLLAGLVRLTTPAGRVRRLEPAPLGYTDVARLVADRLGHDPEPALVERIHRRSEGNPMFVEALADADDAATPVLLRDLLLSGFRALPEDSRGVLHAASVAAVGGGAFGHALLVAVTGLDDLVLEAALRPAVERGLLLPSADGRGYRFRHALLRQAVYEDMLPSARTRLHARSGAALLADPGLVPDGRAAAEQAAHWCAAGEWERAFDALWCAASAAQAVHAHPERLRILTRVLHQWNHIQEPERRLGVDRVNVLHRAAEACLSAGEAAKGVELTTEALGLLDPGEDPERAALLLELRSMLRHRLGDEALDDLRAGVALLSAEPTAALRGRLLSTLANRLFLLSHVAESREIAAEALAVGRAHDDARVQAWALLTLGSLAGQDGDLDGARAAFAEAVQVTRSAGDSAVPLVIAAMAEADALHALGRNEQACDVARQGRETARRAGLARDHGAALAVKAAESLIALGRWQEARSLLRESLAPDPPPLFQARAQINLGVIALAEGDPAGAAEAADAAHGIMGGAYRGGTFRLALYDLRCRVALAQGDLARADAVLGCFLAEPGLSDLSRFAWPLLVTGARLTRERVARAIADPLTGAEDRLAQLHDLAERLPVIGHVQAAQKTTFLAETGKAGWEEAVRAWRDLGRPYWTAYALWQAAETSPGPAVRSGTWLREAASIADRLGAVPLLREIEHLAVRARLSLDGPKPEPGPEKTPDPLGLTPRETEVLRLVSEGRSNRQIAEALFISAKTAGVHVSNILAKLQVSSRTEAAALAHRLRLFGSSGNQ